MARLLSDGALLRYATLASPNLFTTFGLVIELPSPSLTSPEFETTNLEDDAKTFELGKADHPTVNVRFFYDPVDASQYRRVFTAVRVGEVLRWRVVNPPSVAGNRGNSSFTFEGEVAALSSLRNVNAMITGTMGLRVTGPDIDFQRETLQLTIERAAVDGLILDERAPVLIRPLGRPVRSALDTFFMADARILARAKIVQEKLLLGDAAFPVLAPAGRAPVVVTRSAIDGLFLFERVQRATALFSREAVLFAPEVVDPSGTFLIADEFNALSVSDTAGAARWASYWVGLNVRTLTTDGDEAFHSTDSFPAATSGTIADAIGSYGGEANPPIARWRFDETSGTVIADSAGSFTGTTQGSPTFTAGHLGNAIVLNGTTQWVDFGNATALIGMSRTYAFWIWVDDLAVVQKGIFCKLDNATAKGVLFDQIGAAFRIYVETGSPQWQVANYFTGLTAQWVHCAVVLDNGVIRLYRGGTVLSGTGTGTYATVTADPGGTANTALIGRQANLARFFPGRIDDFRVYNRALTASEVAALAADQLGGTYGSPPYLHQVSSGTIKIRAFAGVDWTQWTTPAAGIRQKLYDLPAVAGMLDHSPTYRRGPLGYWKVRFKVNSQTKGQRWAWWLLPKSGARPPEVVLVERVEDGGALAGKNSHRVTKRAGDATPAQYGTTSYTFDASGFHDYSVELRSGWIVHYVDNVEMLRTVNPFGDVTDWALGGSWDVGSTLTGDPTAATTWPAEVEVDYARIYSSKAVSPDAGPFADDWTGLADGAEWSSAKWTGKTLGSGTPAPAIDALAVAGNPAGRIVPQGLASTYAKITARCGWLANFELFVKFTMTAGGEQYHGIYVRSQGTPAAHPEEPPNCYRIRMRIDSANANRLTYCKVEGDVRGAEVAAAHTWSTTQWNLRIRCEGSSIRARAWQGAEPGTWDIDQTDATHTIGEIVFASINGSGATTAKPILYDDLSIVEL